MQETQIVTRDQYLNGECLLQSFQPHDIKRKRIKTAQIEFASVLFFVGLWMWPFGYEHLCAFAKSISTLSLPATQDAASFVFFAVALRFAWEKLTRIANEVRSHSKARLVLADMRGWLTMLERSGAGLRVNLITHSDSGQNMRLELYGVNKDGQAVLLTMNSQGYSRSYDTLSHTKRPAILKRILDNHPRLPKAVAEQLLDLPPASTEVYQEL